MASELADQITYSRIITKVDDGALRLNLAIEDSLPYVLRDEMAQELDLCATGDRKVDVRVTITEFDIDDPSWPMHKIDGVHHIGGVVEFVDPSGEIIGRYRLRSPLPSQSDMRELRFEYSAARVGAETFGRAVCREVFGRNPRRDDPQRNSTPE